MEIEKKLIDAFFNNHPAESVQALKNFDGRTLGELLETLDPRSAATSLQKAPAKKAAVALGNMKSQSAARILRELPFDTQLVLLHSVNAEKRERLLNALPDTHSKKLHRLLDYPEGSAGYLMDPSLVTILPDASVKDAIKQIRAEADSARFYIYVTDDKRRLTGVVTLRDLFKAQSQVAVSSIMSTEIASLPAMASQRDVIKHPQWKKFHELPVIDRHKVLIGVIRYETFGRIKSARSSDNTSQDQLTTLLALSELYWLGMTGFLNTISIPAGEKPTPPATPGVTDDD